VIRYSLVCANAHEFESWFKDSEAYEAQSARGLLTCPACNSSKVEKAIMTPRVARKDRDVAAPASHDRAVVLATPEQTALRAKLRELRQMLVENSDYVGASFPEEARRIHYGEADQRAIHGEASLDEVRTLIDEGVEIMPLPLVPDERN
jgi:hypothetical protein